MRHKDQGRGPIRTCKVCGCKAPKSTLCRFVWHEGKPVADQKKLLSGRGSYCCNKDACLSGFWGRKKKWKTDFRL